MKPPFLFTAPILIGLLFGCGEKQPDLSNFITHQSGEIVFDYPGNWKVTDNSLTATIHNLFVETPGDAIVIIQSYPLEMAQELKSFSEDFSESASLGTPLVSINKAAFVELPKQWGYDWISEDFEIGARNQYFDPEILKSKKHQFLPLKIKFGKNYQYFESFA